jgi:hypothetical protein
MLPIMLRDSSHQHCPYPVKLNDFTCYSFEQEPFKSLPLIWTIHERLLATRSRQYISSGQIDLLNDWKRVFNRSTVVVFPNYVLPVIFNGLFFSFRHSSTSYVMIYHIWYTWNGRFTVYS